MGWSTKWEDVPVSEEPVNSPEFIKKCNDEFDKEFNKEAKTLVNELGKELLNIVETELYKEPTIKNIFGTGISTDKENPNAILTFECDTCHTEFNCNTIKFGVLCDQAAIAGWRIIWLDHGYKSYCGQCKGKIE